MHLNLFGLLPPKSPLPGCKTFLEVPQTWVGFFQALLNAPAHQTWVKKLLESSFPSSLVQSSSETLKAIPLPASSSDTCSFLLEESSYVKNLEDSITEQAPEETPPSKKRGRKHSAETPIVESAVRRSSRLRALNNGFKADGCKIKNCLGCASPPPILSPASLKSIGASFCQISPEDLEEHVLLQKKSTEPIGKKHKKKNKEDSKNDEGKGNNEGSDGEDDGSK